MFWKKSGNGKLTRILYGSDFHGSEAVFRKFISAAFQYKANVLIVGGDVTGKAMVPVVHQGGGVYVGHLFGSREELSSREQLEKFTKTVSNVGFYPIIVEKDEAAALERDQEMLHKCSLRRGDVPASAPVEIGVSSMVLPLLFAEIGGWILCTQAFKIDFYPFIGALGGMAMAGALLVIVTGLAGTLPVLKKKPAVYLREVTAE